MAESEIHHLRDTVLRFCACRGVGGRRQVIVHVRLTEFCDGLEGVTVFPAMISFRFHLGQLSPPRALPRIVSFVASHLDAKKRQLCERRMLRFALQAAAGTPATGSALLLLFDIGAFHSQPGWLVEDLEFMAQWMLHTPLEVEEGDYVRDYYLEAFDGFGGIPASRSFITALEPSAYGSGEGIREKQCIICLEDFDVGAEVSKMPCSHTFHNQCIIRWLEESHVCPVCRHEMPTSGS